MVRKFNLITACGTFDRLHKGHEFFLKRAFEVSQGVLIGITSDKWTRTKPLGFVVQSYTNREGQVINFLKKSGLARRATIFKLNNVYGPAVRNDTKIEGILVTQDSIIGAQLINRRRKALKLSPLKIIKIPFLKENYGKQYSSLKSRRDIIMNTNLVLPQNLRSYLKKPLGKLLKGEETDLTVAVNLAKRIIKRNKNRERPKFIVAVGDVVTKSFNQADILIDLAIVDFRIKRKVKIKSLTELGFSKKEADITVKNPPGSISSTLSASIKKLVNRLQSTDYSPKILRVVGEEDLSVLPAIVLSPQGSVVFYGQPEKGIVAVWVNDEVKSRTLELLAKFKILLL